MCSGRRVRATKIKHQLKKGITQTKDQTKLDQQISSIKVKNGQQKPIITIELKHQIRNIKVYLNESFQEWK